MSRLRYFSAFKTPALWAALALVVVCVQSSSSQAAGILVCEAMFKKPVESPEDNRNVRTFEASTNRSQKVRDNAPDFWKFCLNNGASYFGDLNRFVGLVVGDTHPGNFVRLPLAGHLRYFVADIKDAGDAPFIFDIARLVVSTQAAIKKIRQVPATTTASTLMEAYLKGLDGEPFETPATIAPIFEKTLEKYQTKQDKYVAKRVLNDKFIYTPGAIEPLHNASVHLENDIRQAVAEAYPNATVLDLAFRPRDRGGSQQMSRYWALLRQGTALSIVEFKQVSEPATASYERQVDTVTRYNRVMDIFWGVRDPNYRVVNLNGVQFWLRPKKTDLFRVPYKQETEADTQYLIDLARYDAHLLGQMHRRQSPPAQYSRELHQQQQSVVDALAVFYKDYMGHLKSAIADLTAPAESDDDGGGGGDGN